MAELKNSQRITYKATYNQISPTATIPTDGKSKSKFPSRAIEKTVFVQSLRIISRELAGIKDQLSGRANVPASIYAQVPTALAAIKQVINDKTATSTLSNAALFAKIDPAALILVANKLIANRQTIAESINRSVADILSAYRNSLVAPGPSRAAAPTTAAKLPKGASHKSGTTNSGIPVITTVIPLAATKLTGAKPKIETRAFSAHVTLDASKPAAAGFSAVLTMDSSVKYTPSKKDAIIWAEQNQPGLFAGLSDQLHPYMEISTGDRNAISGSQAVIDLLTNTFKLIFDTRALQGAVAGFQTRMNIEPVGNLHLERIEMYPAGIERGELAHSVPLAPGETVNISHKEWSVSEKEFEEIVQDFFEGYSEHGVAEKNDIAMANDSQSQHATALNVGASLSASYSSVTLSTNFGYNATSNDSQSKKDSRNHSMAITKKASARTKKEHKVTFKVTSVSGSEDQSVRVISNPSPTDAMRIDYFQLARKWKVDLLRYGLRMTYDVVIPNPGSGIVTLVDDLKALDALINTPFTFPLPLSAISYNPLASDPHNISNYDQLAAQYNAIVTPPPDALKWVNAHKEATPAPLTKVDEVHFDSVEFDIDDNYYVYDIQLDYEYVPTDPKNYFTFLDGQSIPDGIKRLIGKSGHLSFEIIFQNVNNFAINITFICQPRVQVVLDWRLQAWNQIRQAAENQYNKSMQDYKDQRAKLAQEIADYDALTLRRMEQEEIMKGVLRWLLGPQFHLVPFDISSLFAPDTSDPEVKDVLDPNRLTDSQWLDVMEHGEFIKYIHNAIEWENVLYFTYPYFWDDKNLWDFKKFLYHPDPTHRTFLRSGAARVVLTIRPGFESTFAGLVESGAITGNHPYVTIAQEIQDFANTNYPGFPPANPEQNARPLLYLEQRRVWKEMQFIIQLLNVCKATTGNYPPEDAGNTVPVAALTPYLNGLIVININGVNQNFNGINDYNTQANTQQLALDPNTPQEALLPTYAAVPINDRVWNNPYFYKCPGNTGDYDLICYGADGQPGGTDKDADISANCEASLISTWYEYTPTNAMDIGITMNQPNVVPPEPSTDIA